MYSVYFVKINYINNGPIENKLKRIVLQFRGRHKAV